MKKRNNTHIEILRKTAELLLTQNIEDVTIDIIAQEVGIRKASVFHHYSTRLELLQALVTTICTTGVNKEHMTLIPLLLLIYYRNNKRYAKLIILCKKMLSRFYLDDKDLMGKFHQYLAKAGPIV